MDLEVQVVMRAKDWLEQEEWENVAVDSQKFSHYTTLDKILEEYAKVEQLPKLEGKRMFLFLAPKVAKK